MQLFYCEEREGRGFVFLAKEKRFHVCRLAENRKILKDDAATAKDNSQINSFCM